MFITPIHQALQSNMDALPLWVGYYFVIASNPFRYIRTPINSNILVVTTSLTHPTTPSWILVGHDYVGHGLTISLTQTTTPSCIIVHDYVGPGQFNPGHHSKSTPILLQNKRENSSKRLAQKIREFVYSINLTLVVLIKFHNFVQPQIHFITYYQQKLKNIFRSRRENKMRAQSI